MSPPAGHTPSGEDYRDFRVSGLNMARDEDSPKRARISHTIAVRNQGEVDCCVAAAVVLAMEAMDQQMPPSTKLSVLYLYWECQAGAGNMGDDSPRRVLDQATDGICPANLHESRIAADLGIPWPEGNRSETFTEEMARVRPSREASRAARDYAIDHNDLRGRDAYYRLPDLDRLNAWRYALSRGFPVIFGFQVSREFLRLRNDPSGVHPGRITEYTGARHAVTALGYDDDSRLVEIKDCQGKEFGRSGRWSLPYSLINNDMIEESWIIGRLTYD